MSHQVVTRFSQVRRFYEALRTRRGDVAWVGDSNLAWTTGSGYVPAAEAEMHRRFGLYASGVYPGQPQSVRGLGYHAGFDSGRGYEAPAAGSPHRPYVPPGADVGGGFTFAPGVFVAAATPDDLAHPSARMHAAHPRNKERTRWRFVYGTHAGGGGRVAPACWIGGTFTWLVVTQLDTNTGTVGLAEHAVELPADPARTYDVRWQYNYFFNDPPPAGPFTALWQRLEWPDAPRGAAVSMFWQYVGGTATQAVGQFAGITQLQFDAYVNFLVGQQGAGRKLLLVPIAFGPNDYNAGRTPGQVAADVGAIVARFRGLWTAGGRDADDLYFRTGPYHPLEGDRGRWQRDLDDALEASAAGESNVAHVSHARLTSAAYLRAAGAYEGAGDPHLTAAGYGLFAALAANAEQPIAAVLVRHATSGGALDLKLFDEAGQVWDAVARSFGPWSDAGLANYCIAGQELGTSRVYRFDLPADLPATSVLRGDVTARAGPSPALGDAAVAALGPGDFAAAGRDAVSDLADGQADAVRRLAALDVPVSRAGTGSGTIPVDHNTGGPDALRYVDGQNAGVAGATVRAYAKADYDAGAYVERGRTVTKADGRWVAPVYLDPGVAYTLTFAKPGVYQTSRRDVSV